MEEFNFLPSIGRNPSDVVESLVDLEQNKIHNQAILDFSSSQIEQKSYYSNELNELLIDEEDDSINFINFSNINSNNGRPKHFQEVEGSEDSPVYIQLSMEKTKKFDNKIFFTKNENAKNEDNIKGNFNQKENDSNDYGIENKKEENEFIEKEKKAINIEVKEENNIKKIENVFIEKENEREKEKGLLNIEINKEQNIIENKIKKDKILCFDDIKSDNKSEKNLYIDFNLFRKMIRDKIKEIIKAIKEKKKGSILLNIKEDISSISKEKNKKKVKKNKKAVFAQYNIKKKIESKSPNAIIEFLNENLESGNSEKYFEILTEYFFTNITKKINEKMELFKIYKQKEIEIKNNMLNKKRYYKKRLKKKKVDEMEKELKIDKKNYFIKLEEINYVKSNKEKSYVINYNNIKEKIFSLFKEYLESHEFEEDVLKLLDEKDIKGKNIIDHIIKTFESINYFSKSN